MAVLEMVGGHRRDDGVKAPERGQRFSQVVADELDPLVPGEALACRREHQLGALNPDTAHGRSSCSRASSRASSVPRSRMRAASRAICSSSTLFLGATRMLLCPAALAIDVRGGLRFRHESQYAPTARG